MIALIAARAVGPRLGYGGLTRPAHLGRAGGGRGDRCEAPDVQLVHLEHARDPPHARLQMPHLPPPAPRASKHRQPT